MKKKITVSIGLFTLAVLTAVILYAQNQSKQKNDLAVTKIDGNGFFAGNKKTPAALKTQYYDEINKDDQAHEYLRQGNNLKKQGKLMEAAEAYKNSYNIGGMSRAVAGFKLAKTYEELGRYDEAITQLNQMFEKHQLSELGIQDANEIKSRLLVAKNRANQSVH